VFRKGDRFFRSGDILIQDEFGWLYFQDRQVFFVLALLPGQVGLFSWKYAPVAKKETLLWIRKANKLFLATNRKARSPVRVLAGTWGNFAELQR
jgi:hypothetical protein